MSIGSSASDDSALTPYPPAPWQLRGWGVALVHGVPAQGARHFVPSDCAIVAIAPGRTLGGLLFVSYEFGSTIVYRELAVVAALVRVGRRLAFFLPRLYVDSAASLAGGRGIWGVRKDLASFDVAASATKRTIVVRSDGADVCKLQAAVARTGVRLPLPMPAFGTRSDRFLFFTARLAARLSLIGATVEMPRDGEFAALSLERPLFAVAMDGLDLRIPLPIEVPRRRMSRAWARAARIVVGTDVGAEPGNACRQT